MKRKYFKMFFINLIAFLVAIFFLMFLGDSVIFSVANGIFGEEKGILGTNIIIRILMNLVLIASIHFQNLKNDDDFEAYTSAMKEKEYKYDFKTDIKEIFKGKAFWIEFILFTVLCAATMFLIAIPLFIPINLFSHVFIHKSWIKEKTEF